MKALINQLDSIFKKNPLGEKVLIVPKFSAGRQLIDGCTKSGLKPLNLKIMTLSGLAEEVCKQMLFRSKRSIIPTALGQELFIGILKNLSDTGKLTYFNCLEVTPGVSRVIYNAINELKMQELTMDKVSPTKFVNTAKGEDILHIWAEYEKELQSRGFLDLSDLYTEAITPKMSATSRTYIVLSNLKLTSLERDFLELLTKRDYEVFHLPRPKGIAAYAPLENNILPVEKDISALNKLLWLYDLPNASANQQVLPVELFRSYGESNELNEVLRKIKKRELPFDQTAIYYTTEGPYAPLTFTLTQELNLPVTFGSGINIRFTSPGRLYHGLLTWAENGFRVSDFIPLLLNGGLNLSDQDAPSKLSIIRLLRNSSIGWGKERYATELEKAISLLEQEIEDTGKQVRDSDSFMQSKLLSLKWLKEFFVDIFDLFPEPNLVGNFSYGKFAGWLLKLMHNFSLVKNIADGDAKKVICEHLLMIRDWFQEGMELKEIYSRLSVISEKQVNASNPKPGYLHVDHYRAGIYIDRPHVFVVGLDANRFPGSRIEDPILLDVERENLGYELPLRGLRYKEKTYDLVQFLGTVSGSLTASYTAFDTAENRVVFPAAVLLQLYRLLTGDETQDYSDLIKSLGERKGFIPYEPEEALGATEWWLYQLTSGKKLDLTSIKSLYPALYNGLQADIKKQGVGLTVHDGLVKIDGAMLDPTVNHNLILSCSELETLAKCPYSYFLRYVLRVVPREELTYDPNRWLDSKTKGSLFHAIFYKFYRELQELGAKPGLVKHQNYLFELADELITLQRSEVPPPNELVFEQDRRNLLDSCRVFLRSEEVEAQNSHPEYFELTFGMSGDNAGLGEVEAISITMPNGGRFYLKGKIDRVDKTSAGYKVWDYKTGSTYGYSDREHFKGGRQLQHALYPLAVEQIFLQKGISSNPKVIESGYIFPTVKGEGKRVLRSQVKRDSFYEILDQLLVLLTQGIYVMTEDDNDCTFCDYAEACNRSSREPQSLQKMMVDAFRRLRSYA
ncbi:hypothetical protein Desaci_3881 [Desulfosporosinus acidiphilus SJ4]|uniref:PD-(D/E)XK endonuclease-like domain-containing protein n=1 Tax=Desulfosporosinus acidiphilus (strain DSM 22704 / JCM 16185 / SJ4) TaxID=646529 RepID=I4DAD5_DESAJ|nr:PD-(D/E)XK nuclease family protein [Desulfosporosinus acidiphilus]AFM42759.1 hypothetical protein Desaci_3881 [Desulfosporosinus acidiphilus SJ4]